MENFNPKKYRDNLAEDLKNIRQENPKAAKISLEEEKKTLRYDLAKNLRDDKEDINKKIEEIRSSFDKAFYNPEGKGKNVFFPKYPDADHGRTEEVLDYSKALLIMATFPNEKEYFESRIRKEFFRQMTTPSGHLDFSLVNKYLIKTFNLSEKIAKEIASSDSEIKKMLGEKRERYDPRL